MLALPSQMLGLNTKTWTKMDPKFQIVDIDLDSIKRQRAWFSQALPTVEEIHAYMVENGILDIEQLRILQEKINQRLREAESSPFQVFMSKVWYFVKGQIKLDVESLYKILSNFDKIADFMPNSFWREVVNYIDKIGEYLLANKIGVK